MVYLIVVHQHIRQMIHSSVFNGLGFRLLGVAIMRCKPNFGWVIQAKMVSYSFHDIIISVEL